MGLLYGHGPRSVSSFLRYRLSRRPTRIFGANNFCSRPVITSRSGKLGAEQCPTGTDQTDPCANGIAVLRRTVAAKNYVARYSNVY